MLGSENRQTLEQLQFDKTKLFSSWFSRSRISRGRTRTNPGAVSFRPPKWVARMKEGMSYELLGSYGFPFGAIKVRREQGRARQRGLVAVEDKEDVLLARALIGINASIMMRTA